MNQIYMACKSVCDLSNLVTCFRKGDYGKPFRAACARMGIWQSMGRLGSALDNAMIKSWHSTLLDEHAGYSLSEWSLAS